MDYPEKENPSNEVLEQSLALNKITMDILDSKKKSDFWLHIILIISILVNVVIAGMFIWYESQWTTTATTTTTTVTQDTGEGEGNNVYQAGEQAEYVQE